MAAGNSEQSDNGEFIKLKKEFIWKNTENRTAHCWADKKKIKKEMRDRMKLFPIRGEQLYLLSLSINSH